MDPATTELRFDTPLLRIYNDGRVERLFGTETTPAGFDGATGVTSKDVVIDDATGVSARLYIPDLPASGPGHHRKKLPIVVYFHGGGMVLDSAASPTYHRYLNSLVSKAGALAVSVNYRLAPEHPLPAAYDDAWAALSWTASAADPWLSEHGDVGRVFLAGDSGGANVVHNVAIMAGAGQSSLPPGATVEEGAPSLQKLGCRKLLVCSAESDIVLARAAAYYQAVMASGWPGMAEWLESKGEEHVFFLNKPDCEESVALMDRVVAFLAGN
uniref:Alpha/beta hydrolase fold-3 domain-containing protein n=1 Tax=Oryza glumipatula TaxID=40148 RepID=A0A0E0B3Y5_9ORYZ